jgi:hypothetical protein
MSTLNEMLAAATRHHRVDCVEDANHVWTVVCRVCTEERSNHPNRGHPRTWPAPFGEEMAARIALDHLARLGYVPRRLAGMGQGRNRYE